MSTTRNTIKLFLRQAWQYPYRTSGLIVGAVLAPLVGAFVAPYIISIFLDRLQSGSLNLDDAWPLIGVYLVAQIYGEIIGWRLNLYLNWTMLASANRDLYEKIFTTLSRHSLGFHGNRFGGALVSQTTKLITAFERFWDTITFQFVPSVTSVIAAVTILSFTFWQYAVVLAVLSVVFVTIIIKGSKLMSSRSREEAQAHTNVNAQVADAITNIATIKSHGTEDRELEAINEKTLTWKQKSLHTMRGFLFVSTGYSSMIVVLNTSALIAAVWASSNNLISIAAVYLAITYTFTVARQLWEMNSVMRNYHRFTGDAYDMVEILNKDFDIEDSESKKLKVTKGRVSFENVVFSYDKEDKKVFNKLSLDIEPGQKVGLVGHSGAGKTTVTHLLLRFADINEGSIIIDDQDIKKITQKSLRQCIAYVPQEPMLFHRSLRENIAYGKPGASEKEIFEAAKKANALEFIEKLPKGLDTLVGERGVKLSGGQRQRVAIARAILKDAPILVLDEATSALDSESEKLIQEALNKLMKNRTSIVIAHRLSTIAKLDRIVVMDNGQIIEDGTHQQLLKAGGTYAGLWSHQSGGFIEE